MAEAVATAAGGDVPPDPNQDLWAAGEALPTGAGATGREAREELWQQFGATVVEALSVQEMIDGLQGHVGIRCGTAVFDVAAAVQKAHGIASKASSRALRDQMMFPQFRLLLGYIKVALCVLQRLLASRAAPASPGLAEAAAAAMKAASAAAARAEAAEAAAAMRRGEGSTEESEAEAEAAASAAASAASAAAVAALEAKATKLAAALPEWLGAELLGEAAARAQELGVKIPDVGGLFEELLQLEPGGRTAEGENAVRRAALPEWAAGQAAARGDFKEDSEKDSLAASGPLAGTKERTKWLQSALAVRRTRKDLYGPNQPPTALIDCLQADDIDLELVEILVAQKKVDKNARDETFGWTPLLYAAHVGSVEIMQLLLKAKANLQACCNNQNSALHLAARGDYAQAVRFLASAGAALNVRNGNGWTALTWASALGLREVVSALLDAQAALGVADDEGRTEAMWAARHGHTETIKLLLDRKGFDLETRDRSGLSLADHAQGFVEIRGALLKIQAANQGLLDAVQRDDAATARRALEEGAYVNAQDDNGWTALTWSMMNRSLGLVRLLAQYNADPAALEATAEVLADLDMGGPGVRAELERTVQEGLVSRVRLLEAARAGRWEEVEQELNNGALVNGREEITLLSSLMFAAVQCNRAAISMLAAKDAKLNLRDCKGWAAVHFAVQAGDVEAVSILQHFKADMSAVTHAGATVQHLAASADDAAMVQVLAAAQCGFSEEDCMGEQPVQVAARLGSAAALSVLLACGGSAAVADRSGRTLLTLAVVHGHVSVVQALLGPPMPPVEVCEHHLLKSEDPRLELLRMAEELHGRLIGRFHGVVAGADGGVALPDTHGEEEKQGSARRSSSKSSKDGNKKKASRGGGRTGRGRTVRSEVNFGTQGLPSSWGAALLEKQDGDGQRPLVLAVRFGRRDIVPVLLSYRAAVNMVDADGSTPLMLAAARGDRHMVEDLLLAGARRDVRSKNGATVLELASTPDIRQLLHACAVEEQVARAIAKMPPVEDPKTAQRTFYRVRLEGLPFLLLEEEMLQLVQDLLRNVLHGAAEPHRAIVATDPITQHPQGHVYVDFDQKEDARELERRRKDCRLGPRRLQVINEGPRTEACEPPPEVPEEDEDSAAEEASQEPEEN